MGRYNFNIDTDKSGVEIRNHLIKLQTHLPNFNVLYANALLEEDNAKAILNEVEHLAEDAARNDNAFRKGASEKKIGLMTKRVKISSGHDLTIPEARKMFNEAKHNSIVAKLNLEELKTAIQTYRSVLTWDRVEFENVF